MKKTNIIQKNNDFSKIIEKNKPYKNNYFTVFVEKNNQNNYRFGISIGKKVGNAVIRNKIKRQIKNILDTLNYKIIPEYDCIIIVKSNIINLSFNQIKEELIIVLNKVNIYKEK
jgi:ribonuclease P protein component